MDNDEPVHVKFENTTQRYGQIGSVSKPETFRTSEEQTVMTFNGEFDRVSSDHSNSSVENESKPYYTQKSAMTELPSKCVEGATSFVTSQNMSLFNIAGQMEEAIQVKSQKRSAEEGCTNAQAFGVSSTYEESSICQNSREDSLAHNSMGKQSSGKRVRIQEPDDKTTSCDRDSLSEEEDMVYVPFEYQGDGRKREAKRHKSQVMVAQDEIAIDKMIRDYQNSNEKIIEIEQELEALKTLNISKKELQSKRNRLTAQLSRDRQKLEMSFLKAMAVNYQRLLRRLDKKLSMPDARNGPSQSSFCSKCQDNLSSTLMHHRSNLASPQ